MRVLQIATVGEDVEPILVGVRELPVSKLVLLYTPDVDGVLRDLKQRLAAVKVPVDTYPVRGDPVVRVMQLVAEILQKEMLHYDEVFFNVSSGSKMLSCAGLSAAFVNGIKAIGATESGLFHLPVLKFSFSDLISEPKLKILRALRDADGSVESLAVLEEKAKVEKSLLSYHIRGGKDSKGLEHLGLVSVDRREYGKLSIRLTELGRLVLTGR
ncbi:MAG: HFX_2341 family transcriptional regulator domain-containing protein [Methanobacteriota archaeon]